MLTTLPDDLAHDVLKRGCESAVLKSAAAFYLIVIPTRRVSVP